MNWVKLWPVTSISLSCWYGSEMKRDKQTYCINMNGYLFKDPQKSQKVDPVLFKHIQALCEAWIIELQTQCFVVSMPRYNKATSNVPSKLWCWFHRTCANVVPVLASWGRLWHQAIPAVDVHLVLSLFLTRLDCPVLCFFQIIYCLRQPYHVIVCKDSVINMP